MTSISINGKEISLYWGALVSEWLWIDTMNGDVTSARSDHEPVTLFYAHKNWQRCDPDTRKLQATKGDFYKWYESATDEMKIAALDEYKDSISKERWDKLQEDFDKAIQDQKKILGETSGDIVTE
jgi:hypothetical protein